MPDDEILSHRRVALLELVQKHIRTCDMLELATDIARLLNLWAIPKEQFRSLMYYIAEQGNTSDESQFLQHIATIATDYQEDIMTIAEQLEAKAYTTVNHPASIESSKNFILNRIIRIIPNYYLFLFLSFLFGGVMSIFHYEDRTQDLIYAISFIVYIPNIAPYYMDINHAIAVIPVFYGNAPTLETSGYEVQTALYGVNLTSPFLPLTLFTAEEAAKSIAAFTAFGVAASVSLSLSVALLSWVMPAVFSDAAGTVAVVSHITIIGIGNKLRHHMRNHRCLPPDGIQFLRTSDTRTKAITARAQRLIVFRRQNVSAVCRRKRQKFILGHHYSLQFYRPAAGTVPVIGANFSPQYGAVGLIIQLGKTAVGIKAPFPAALVESHPVGIESKIHPGNRCFHITRQPYPFANRIQLFPESAIQAEQSVKLARQRGDILKRAGHQLDMTHKLWRRPMLWRHEVGVIPHMVTTKRGVAGKGGQSDFHRHVDFSGPGKADVFRQTVTVDDLDQSIAIGACARRFFQRYRLGNRIDITAINYHGNRVRWQAVFICLARIIFKSPQPYHPGQGRRDITGCRTDGGHSGLTVGIESHPLRQAPGLAIAVAYVAVGNDGANLTGQQDIRLGIPRGMPGDTVNRHRVRQGRAGTGHGAKAVVGGDNRVVGIVESQRVNRYHLAVLAVRRQIALPAVNLAKIAGELLQYRLIIRCSDAAVGDGRRQAKDRTPQCYAYPAPPDARVSPPHYPETIARAIIQDAFSPPGQHTQGCLPERYGRLAQNCSPRFHLRVGISLRFTRLTATGLNAGMHMVCQADTRHRNVVFHTDRAVDAGASPAIPHALRQIAIDGDIAIEHNGRRSDVHTALRRGL
uniref:Transposase (putative) YhgA-like domain-containing protein n=1 Tax=Glossina brevipalpis TaxID=37001 RepID=A0A1A9WSH3_9MUSC